MRPDHPAYEHVRLAVEALCTRPEPIHTRLQIAEQHFRHAAITAPPGSAEWNLCHRIGSSLVEGGADDDPGTVAASIAALDESRAIDIAIDMLHLFELLAGIADDDAPWLWPKA
jgi:hypothetical protein